VTSGASNTIAGVVLFPGAGSSASHASLVSLEEALSPLPVARIDFPYRRSGKSFPDKTPVLVECVRSEVRAFAEQLGVQTSQLLIGGRSMGDVAALVLMSYPLHPPKKPENLRTEHLPRINVPTLCISGTKDNFGSPEELERAFSVVPARVQWHWVQDGRHELAKADAEIAATVLRFIQTV
jgi:predicted alpha/beta-hydrolase family hydrolase